MKNAGDNCVQCGKSMFAGADLTEEQSEAVKEAARFAAEGD